MPVEMLSNSAKTKEKVRSNALDDWKNIEKWANTLLEHGTVNNVLSIEQATKEADIASVLWKRTKNAKGGDCLSDWNTFQSAFAAWISSVLSAERWKSTHLVLFHRGCRFVTAKFD